MKSSKDACPVHFVEPIAGIFESVRVRRRESRAIHSYVYFTSVEVIGHEAGHSAGKTGMGCRILRVIGRCG